MTWIRAARAVVRGRALLVPVILELSAGSAALPAQQVVTLEEALGSALSRSPTIEAADATAAAASSARWADWGAFLPTIRANVDLSSTDFTNVTYLTPEGSPDIIDPPLTDVSKGSNASLSFSLPLLNPERIAAVEAGGSR